MKLLGALLVLFPTLVFASEDYAYINPINIKSSEIDASLTNGQAVYEFEFISGAERTLGESAVQYSIDKVNYTQFTKNGVITISTTPGKHIFQFYYNDDYLEVFSEFLNIQPKHRDRYTVQLSKSTEIKMVFKPVIYLYPQESTDVEVKLALHGDNEFLYPAYEDGWRFTAQPNGDLTFGDDTYNYLFWECTNRKSLSPKQTASGFFVEGADIVSFLEEKLDQVGFSGKEKADFITFWGPRLAVNELNFVHFEFNEECNKYADLSISPQPDNIYRIFMVWGSVSEAFEVKEQEMKRIDRAGFSVIEWGGMESKIKQSFVNQNQ